MSLRRPWGCERQRRETALGYDGRRSGRGKNGDGTNDGGGERRDVVHSSANGELIDMTRNILSLLYFRATAQAKWLLQWSSVASSTAPPPLRNAALLRSVRVRE
jgi:hypothetical protein